MSSAFRRVPTSKTPDERGLRASLLSVALLLVLTRSGVRSDNAIAVDSCLPTLFLVGNAKSGTSSLAYYLRQHPSIRAPRAKETNCLKLSASAREAVACFEEHGVCSSRDHHRRRPQRGGADGGDNATAVAAAPAARAIGLDASPEYSHMSSAQIAMLGRLAGAAATLRDTHVLFLLRDAPSWAYSFFLHQK